MTKYIYIILLACSFASAQSLHWAMKVGDVGNDICSDVAVDAAGNVYAVGIFKNSVDFDPGPGVFYINELSDTVGDMYLAKYNRNGALVWAKAVGGASNYSALDEISPVVSLDNAGNIYVAGIAQNNVDMDPGPATLFLPPLSELMSISNFISKFSNSGNLIWCQQYGGGYGEQWNRGIRTDAAGNIYLAGYFRHMMNFSGAASNFTLTTHPGNYNGYVAKLDADGNFVWAFQVGNEPANDYIHDIDVDSEGNIAITGGYRGAVDFDPGDGELLLQSIQDGEDIFVAKYSADGNLFWGHSFGRPDSTNADEGHAITFDNAGNVISVGRFRVVADFDPAPGDESVFNLETVGNGSEFFLKLSPSGGFIWAKTIGAMSVDGNVSHSEEIYDITTDATGSIYFTGDYVSHIDVDPDGSVFDLFANGGSYQIMNAKWDADGNFQWARSYGAGTNLSATGRSIDVNSFGEVVVGGRFQGSVDFNPGGSPVVISGSSSRFGSFLMSVIPPSLVISSNHLQTASAIPNPFIDEVRIESEVTFDRVEFFDISGRCVLSSDDRLSVDTSSLKGGIYLLQLYTASGIVALKMVKN